MSFTDWFETKLTVGQFPYMVNKEFQPQYKYCINVSDEFYADHEQKIASTGCKTYWFPMNERKRDIGLNSIYGAMIILLQAEKESANVYLHCHSGRNRSRIIQACYYFLRTGNQIEQGNEKYRNRLHRASTRGYLPPMTEMEKFLTAIRIQISNETMFGGMLDECKKEINNF